MIHHVEIRSKINRLFAFICIKKLFNGGADEGISATVRLGTAAAQAAGADGALFAVADQPWLTRASVERVISAFAAHPDTIPALSWQGKKGNPCLFPRELFPELSALTGDTGGGAVIKAHRDRLRLVEAHSPTELKIQDLLVSYIQNLKFII